MTGETPLKPGYIRGPLKVQFGCGKNILPGWQNHDIEVDISKTLPYKSDSVACILAEHVAEHVPAPDSMNFLLECHRILRPRGVLRLIVPCFDKIMELGPAYEVYLRTNHGVDSLDRRQTIRLQSRLWGHKAWFTTELAHIVLWAAGFDIIEMKRPLESDYADLRNVDSRFMHEYPEDIKRALMGETSIFEATK